jgi:hypothetical protein
MSIKYLYIDDSAEREGIARGLSVDRENLTVSAETPRDWKAIIYDVIIPDLKNIDGLLLDWQLQQEADAGDYSSSALAQQIRELANQGRIPLDIPIVLCSAQSNFNDKYGRDQTSHDLFDLIYSKEILSDPATEHRVRNELITLAKVYKTINKEEEYLAIGEGIYKRLDERFVHKIQGFKDSPPHEIARFIKRELIDRQGILVEEGVLAARLGVDLNESQDWERLKDFLKFGLYTGIYSESWTRYWWLLIEDWWKSLETGLDIQNTNAETRVSIIIANTGLNGLSVASKSPYSASDEFWTICRMTEKPIDIYDGFQLKEPINYPWQERNLISNQAVLSGEFTFDVDILEKERLKEFISSIAAYK